ncbi:MAG: response regulator [Nitrospirota bacterium]
MAKKRVMIVDDSVMASRSLKSMVEDIEGFEVVGLAQNGAEAIKLFHTVKPDIICMDIIMPVMDGLSATRTILQMSPQTKIIVISSVGGVDNKANEVLRLGAKIIICKPFDPLEIKERLLSL